MRGVVDPLESSDSEAQHHAGKTRVSDNKIAATAQNKKGKIVVVSEGDSVQDCLFGVGVDKIAGRTTNSQGCERCQWHVFSH